MKKNMLTTKRFFDIKVIASILEVYNICFRTIGCIFFRSLESIRFKWRNIIWRYWKKHSQTHLWELLIIQVMWTLSMMFIAAHTWNVMFIIKFFVNLIFQDFCHLRQRQSVNINTIISLNFCGSRSRLSFRYYIT